MLQTIKTYMLPLAMLTGALFHSFFASLSPITPLLIFTMLLITYCRISLKELHFVRWHYILLAIQLIGSVIIYYLFKLYDEVVAESLLICVLAPTATSSVVITGMLGGNIASLATFNLVINMGVALVAPIIFSLIGQQQKIPFLDSSLTIAKHVFPLLIAPFVGALLLQRFMKPIHQKIKQMQWLSFYLWSFALMLVTGKIVSFVIEQEESNYPLLVIIALLTAILCVAQFATGWLVGNIFSDRIAAGQGMGQKNTILAIWMAQTYLSPLASIGPGTLILWQNIVNSYQLWRKRKTL